MTAPAKPATAHTPGPWRVNPAVLRHMEASIGASESLLIAHVDSVDGFGGNLLGASAANARLIAAAPDLLAFVREVGELDAVSVFEHPDTLSGILQEFAERARSLHARATKGDTK